MLYFLILYLLIFVIFDIQGLPPGMQLPPGMPGAADMYARG